MIEIKNRRNEAQVLLFFSKVAIDSCGDDVPEGIMSTAATVSCNAAMLVGPPQRCTLVRPRFGVVKSHISATFGTMFFSKEI